MAGRLDDVVISVEVAVSVDDDLVAAALVEAALERAAAQGARTVDLTSRPDREAANRLYLRMGFETRATNVYRHGLGAGA